MPKGKFTTFSCVILLVAGCQTIAEQALNNENATDQIAGGQFRVTEIGIYRLSNDQYGNIRGRMLCPEDVAKIRKLQFEPIIRRTNSTIEDEEAFDYFDISIKPPEIGADIGILKAAAGFKFTGIPQVKRVAEKYTTKVINLDLGQEDRDINGEYVYSAVGSTCRSYIDDKVKYELRGKPVYVYAITKGDKVYTKLTGIPSITLGLDVVGKSFGEIKIKGKDIVYDEFENTVFGYLYFPLGAYSNRPIPKVNSN